MTPLRLVVSMPSEQALRAARLDVPCVEEKKECTQHLKPGSEPTIWDGLDVVHGWIRRLVGHLLLHYAAIIVRSGYVRILDRGGCVNGCLSSFMLPFDVLLDIGSRRCGRLLVVTLVYGHGAEWIGLRGAISPWQKAWPGNK